MLAVLDKRYGDSAPVYERISKELANMHPVPKYAPPTTTSFIGIDPGKKGGLAVIWCGGGPKAQPTCAMPATDRDIWQWVSSQPHPAFAVIEKVHAMPGQGVTSMFTFGRGYGAVLMALTAANIPFDEVRPQEWQGKMGIKPKAKSETKDQFKLRLKARAQQLFPGEAVSLYTADALLLAEYCKRKREGTL